jgi:hypothetical protein
MSGDSTENNVSPSRLRGVRYQVFLWIDRAMKIVAVCLILFLVVLLGVPAVHNYLHFCPIKFRSFTSSQLIPIMYGHVWDFHGDVREDLAERARRGEIVIAKSCTPLGYSHICPYCRWPALFLKGTPAEVVLDDETLAGLSPSEREAVDRFMKRVYAQARGDEWVTAVCITSNDIWIGTFNSGLHRMDRKSGDGLSFRDGVIGDCIRSISDEGASILVEHSASTLSLCYKDSPADRGRTWHR